MIGETLSHYRIVSRLGSGGMGVVYEAEDLRLGRRVALKMLPDEAGSDPGTVERFLREARLISSLNHPHICTLHDIGVHHGQHYMVMELLEGESLKTRIARGAMAIGEVLDLGAQTADALDAAHAQGIVHRDLKPANLFVTRRGQMKVLDFGVAKLTGIEPKESDFSETLAPNDLTTAGSAVGTISYMSPEQARGQDIDPRSDLFSLGVVLYEMATGMLAFPGATPAVVFEGILNRTPPVPSQQVADVPVEFDQVVLRALEKDKETRYQSAADLRADLKRIRRLSGSDPGPRTGAATVLSGAPRPGPAGATVGGTVGGTSPARRGRLGLLIGAPMVTLAVIAGVLVWRSTKAPALSAKDAVVLAGFVNRTGDDMFNDTLDEALGVQLRQSPFLNVLPEQQVQTTLRLMGRDPMARVSSDEVGRELCQRAGAKALLGGRISSLGTSYVLTLNAQDCVTGQILAEEQVQPSGRDAVLSALGGAASQFRERLGESLASIERYDAKVEEATTPSLDALRAYSRGVMTRRTQGDYDAVPLFEQAIKLDANFALAYARLGTVLSNLGRRAESITMTEKAYNLREKVSERERLYIEARYNTLVTEDTAKAIESYRVLVATYPNDYAAFTNMGLLLKDHGQTADAIAALKESARLAPHEPLAPLNLAYTYRDSGQYDEARKAFDEAIRLRDSTNARQGLYSLAMLTGDQALADAQVEAVRGRRDESDMLPVRALAEAYHGHLKESATLMDTWTRSMEQMGLQNRVSEGVLGLAIGEGLVGFPDRARARLASLRTRKLLTAGDADERLALAGLLGEAADGRAAFPTAMSELGESRDRLADEVPHLRAMLALSARRGPDAVAALAPMTYSSRYSQTVLVWALANQAVGDNGEVLRAFEWLASSEAQLGLGTTRAFVLVGLARARAATGQVDTARQAYQQFFELWKTADADVPLLIDARREFAKLGT